LNVDIHIPGAKLFDALRSYAERAVHLAVAPDRPISHVAVRFTEYVGEGRGASLTSCRIEALLRNDNTVVVTEATTSNPYRAVDEATARLLAVWEHHVGPPTKEARATTGSAHVPPPSDAPASWLRSSASRERARIVGVEGRRDRDGFRYRRSSAGSRWVS
jgi:ribosome-associated translation inhibitor RaiA